MNKLQEARNAVRSTLVPEALHKLGKENIGSYAVKEARLLYYSGYATHFLTQELTPELLACTLSYIIKLDTRPIEDEQKVTLGASKYKGLPHLPSSLAWPEDHAFLAQLDLQDLAPLDHEGMFPKSGMLYFFISAEDQTILHYDGPRETLMVTPCPETDNDDAGEFAEEGQLITFSPAFTFYLDDDEVMENIPEDLSRKLEEILGCEGEDDEGSLRLFGRPQYWQGEDECWPGTEMWGEEGAPAGFAAAPKKKGGVSNDSRRVLLQDEYGEGTIHIWGDPKKTRQGDFSGCWMTYSGT